MELKVELVDIDTLITDPDNVRLHNDRNRDAVRRSIKQFGIRKPVVAHAKTNIVYAGNLTLDVARELGRKQIPVAWIPADVPSEVCRAYGIADNKTSDLSSFDDERLKEALRTLSEVPEIDIEGVGFSQAEVDALLATVDDFQLEDDFPEVGDDLETEHECPKCGFKWSGK